MDYKKEYYKIKGKYIELSQEIGNSSKYIDKIENINLIRSKIPQICLDTSNILEFNKDNLHIF